MINANTFNQSYLTSINKILSLMRTRKLQYYIIKLNLNGYFQMFSEKVNFVVNESFTLMSIIRFFILNKNHTNLVKCNYRKKCRISLEK